MKRIVLTAVCMVAAVGAAAPMVRAAAAPAESDILPLGFTEQAWDQESALEAEYAALLDRGRLSRTHRELTREPHRAGTEGGRRVARYIEQEAEKAGFRPEVSEYLFYNSHPGARSIEMTAPVRRALSLAEDRIPGDPFTERSGEHLAFCAYSGSGTAEGDVVYVGQGTAPEFQALKERGISLEGRVALMRYFGEDEGRKVLRAQQEGAVAAILYADPLEDGFVQGPVYPQGNWRPPGSIMRRSLLATPYEGDPLSPGWAAVPGAKRLDPRSIDGLPRIPVLPISYRDAALIVSQLGGPAAPEPMQGGLLKQAVVALAPRSRRAAPVPEGVTLVDSYRLGPGPARVRLSVKMEPRTDTIRNVLVRIPGKEEPEAWIILSNHHDAWIYGAGDPSSGTAALLETLRAFGAMRSRGWQPRRTLILAFWDAEEMALGGSTEWAEDHAETLRRKGVAVINMDSAVSNGEPPLFVGPVAEVHKRDPTGTGDAFRAGFLAAVGWGLSLERAAQLGNLVAVSALETVGPQEYELKPPQVAGRLAETYGDAAAAEIAAHYS